MHGVDINSVVMDSAVHSVALWWRIALDDVWFLRAVCLIRYVS